MIVAANRGPVTYERVPGGGLSVRRGAGGLVSALRGLAASRELTWIASAISEADREIAAQHPLGRLEQLVDGDAHVRLLAHDRDAYQRFYAEVANPGLWFTQHQLWDRPYEPSFGAPFMSAWRTGYAPVNKAFAEAVLDELGPRPTRAVVLHDYHLYLAPRLVRERSPQARLALFVHIPWPPPDAVRVLPRAVVGELLDGLLACDVVGFHTNRWRDNFLACCAELASATVDGETVVLSDNRRVRAVTRPISVSPPELREAATSAEVAAEERRLAGDNAGQLIVRVDRTDPSKNVVRGFAALEALLERHPEHVGRVRMLTLLNPSRQELPAYARYAETIEHEAERINDRFGTERWAPVHLEVADNFPRSLAAYKLYDVLFVNAVFDGMNLVAKEGPLLNERAGTVVLSDNTGAYEELAGHVLGVNPFDIGEQAEALHTALALPLEERATRARSLAALIEGHPVEAWSAGVISDLAEAVESSGRTIEP